MSWEAPPWQAMKWSVAIALALGWLPQSAGAPGPQSDPLARIARSGRLDTVGMTSSERLGPLSRLAPGDPPMLAFRYLEDRRRHRFGELDLMMDDAGH